jgi:O-antigen/teichoic acid export membrane protein
MTILRTPAGSTTVEESVEHDRIGVLGRGVIWNWIGFTVAGAASFVLTPIMIRCLGDFYYGLWMLAYSVLSYYTFFDLGLSTSVQRFVALSRVSGDCRAASETISAAVAIMTVISALLVVGTISIAAILPRLRLVSTGTIPLFRTVLLLLAASVVISFLARPAAAYLRGIHRFDLSNGVSAGATLIRAGGIWVVLHRGYGIIAVCLVTLASSAVSLAAYVIVTRNIDRGALRFFAGFQWGRMRQLCRFSVYVFLTSIGDYFRFHMDLLVVAKWIGVALVTPYSVAANLIVCFGSIMGGVCGPLMTELVSRHGERANGTCTFFFRASKVTALLATLGAVLLLANGQQLLQVWLGPSFVGVYATLAALTIAHWADWGQGPSMHLLYSRGRHRAMAYWTIAEGVSNLLLSIYLAGRYGIVGVAIGTAIPMLIIKLLVQPLYTLHVARATVSDYLGKAIARPIAVGAFVSLVAFVAAVRNISLTALVFNIVWQTALFAVAAYVFALTAEERGILSRRRIRVRLMRQANVPEQI